MKDPRKVLLLATIVGLVLMFGVAYLRDPRRTGLTLNIDNASPPPTFTPTATPDPYATWNLFRNGYALPLPPDWKNTSDKGGTAVLEPGTKIGSIQKLSITRLSDAKAPTTQQFTTQKEFDEWAAVEGEVQGPIQKIANINVDAQPGLELLDTRGGDNDWSMIVWVRKDNTNLYLTFQGNEKFSVEDASTIDYIATHFVFTAPQNLNSKGEN